MLTAYSWENARGLPREIADLFRSDTNVRRCSLAPDETAGLFMNYLRRIRLFGLFLSSGVVKRSAFTRVCLRS
jgi:predicted DNA-binding helix-hairpin-helix protein